MNAIGADGYDAIAALYDVDMALNMPFDDVAFYLSVARESGGRILEMGCGNGRILLRLAQAGLDAIGVDRSAGMLEALRRKAHAARITPKAARMDVRELAFGAAFDVVLCPYSLVTSMSTADDAARLMREAHRVLRPGGSVVIDAFVPRDGVIAPDFALDYRRPFGAQVLERSRRITRISPEVNRIERRYRIFEADRLVEEIATREEIRPLVPDALHRLAETNGFTPRRGVWDYRDGAPADGARFFTLVATKEAP
ncbi:MAG: class I SAM-dependent methyltransferase [Bacillota bacterium]